MGTREWILHFVHRYLRLTPVYALMIFSMHYLGPLMARGPKALWVEGDYDSCGEYWWTNLLYINNFIPSDKPGPCFGQTWFLAVDFQLYVFIGTPLVIIFWIKPLLGYLTTIAIVLSSFGANFGVVLAEELPVCKADPDWPTYNADDHVKPWMRMGAYSIGVALAIIMVDTTKVKEQINALVKWWHRILLFLITGGTMIAIILSTWPLYKAGVSECSKHWTYLQNAFYWGLTRPVWAFCLAVWTYLFWLDRTGFLCRCLSAYVWVVPSRLVYCVYLFHPEMIWLIATSRVTPYIYNDLDYTQDWAGLVLTSFFIAGLWYLAGEKPIVNVESVATSYIPPLPNPLFRTGGRPNSRNHHKKDDDGGTGTGSASEKEKLTTP
ncbi:nose resistant to fluoxetine protein 6 [Pelomyxa schiedti]|nr:nose resistant to fluoxetine protein 6 [Pelomyxa schiedti]